MSDLIPPTIASIDSKDAQSKHDSFDGEILVGFPTSENLSMVRLRGEEQTIEFWRQPAVVREVEQRLRETLQRDKLNVFVRVSSDEQWRCLKEKDLVEGEARVGAEIKEICLRIENQLGLYETRTGKALIVRVELGSWVTKKFEWRTWWILDRSGLQAGGDPKKVGGSETVSSGK